MQISTILRNSTGLMALAGLAYAALPTGNSSPNGEASRAAFERFKAMAGQWVELDAEGHKEEQVVSTFRTTVCGRKLRM